MTVHNVMARRPDLLGGCISVPDRPARRGAGGRAPFAEYGVAGTGAYRCCIRACIGSAQRFPTRRLTAEDFGALDMLGDWRRSGAARVVQAGRHPVPATTRSYTPARHTRTGEAERRRHLLRLWLSPPGARPLPPVFAECYGDITIGDRGGIICKGTRPHAPLVPG
jgi:hypothetical protein